MRLIPHHQIPAALDDEQSVSPSSLRSPKGDFQLGVRVRRHAIRIRPDGAEEDE